MHELPPRRSRPIHYEGNTFKLLLQRPSQSAIIITMHLLINTPWKVEDFETNKMFHRTRREASCLLSSVVSGIGIDSSKFATISIRHQYCLTHVHFFLLRSEFSMRQIPGNAVSEWVYTFPDDDQTLRDLQISKTFAGSWSVVSVLLATVRAISVTW